VEEEVKPPQGFVCDGFPRTAAQAALLERALTGLDLEAEAQVVREASRIAPPPPESLPQLQRPLTSGLDAVLVLGLSDPALALKRALGRRVDPLTGKVCGHSQTPAFCGIATLVMHPSGHRIMDVNLINIPHNITNSASHLLVEWYLFA
jgi:hypothetical protein